VGIDQVRLSDYELDFPPDRQRCIERERAAAVSSERVNNLVLVMRKSGLAHDKSEIGWARSE
jgi:hypothetical protein